MSERDGDDGGGYTLDWGDGDQAHRQQPAENVRARRAAPAAGAAPAVGVDLAELERRMEKLRTTQAYMKRPAHIIIRWLSVLCLVLWMASCYQRGAHHFYQAAAISDLALYDWSVAHGNAQSLELHGPTDYGRASLTKTWTNLPEHEVVYLDLRLWAVGACGKCESDDPPHVEVRHLSLFSVKLRIRSFITQIVTN